MPLNKKFTTPSFLTKPEMHGSLHAQTDLFYCLEKFGLLYHFLYQRGKPSGVWGWKNCIKIARLGYQVNTLGYNAELFFLVRIINRLAGLNRAVKTTKEITKYASHWMFFIPFNHYRSEVLKISTNPFLKNNHYVFSIHVALQMNRNTLIKRIEVRST